MYSTDALFQIIGHKESRENRQLLTTKTLQLPDVLQAKSKATMTLEPVDATWQPIMQGQAGACLLQQVGAKILNQKVL